MTTPEHATGKAEAKLADSAVKLKDSAKEQTDSADRRTVLAADRTVFAAERTYAAWVRTGLTSLASGIGAKALLQDVVADWLASATATVLVAFACFCFFAGVWRQLSSGSPPPQPDVRQLPPFILIAMNGFLMLVSLAALVGMYAS